MSDRLDRRAAEELRRPAPAFAAAFGQALARRCPEARAVLFYGSALRAADRDGVLDYYVLTGRPPRGLASRLLWPDVSYCEWRDAEGPLRAKVAVMSLATFRRAAEGRSLDTTVWARFVQPSALVWSDGAQSAWEVAAAMAAAARTACAFAAALGPRAGPARAFWEALFRQTYAAEFRMEKGGRESVILDADAARYDTLLPQAWTAAKLPFRDEGGVLAPRIPPAGRRRLLRAWRVRRALGRPLNIARLAKAAFTFEGAARYAAWKIERHTGLALKVTPLAERLPLLAAPRALCALWRARRRR